MATARTHRLRRDAKGRIAGSGTLRRGAGRRTTTTPARNAAGEPRQPTAAQPLRRPGRMEAPRARACPHRSNLERSSPRPPPPSLPRPSTPPPPRLASPMHPRRLERVRKPLQLGASTAATTAPHPSQALNASTAAVGLANAPAPPRARAQTAPAWRVHRRDHRPSSLPGLQRLRRRAWPRQCAHTASCACPCRANSAHPTPRPPTLIPPSPSTLHRRGWPHRCALTTSTAHHTAPAWRPLRIDVLAPYPPDRSHRHRVTTAPSTPHAAYV